MEVIESDSDEECDFRADRTQQARTEESQVVDTQRRWIEDLFQTEPEVIVERVMVSLIPSWVNNALFYDELTRLWSSSLSITAQHSVGVKLYFFV